MTHTLERQLDALAAWRQALARRIGEVVDLMSEHDLLDAGSEAALDALHHKLAADRLVLACVAEVSRGKS